MNTSPSPRPRWPSVLTLLLGATTLLLGGLALWQDLAFWDTVQGGPVQIGSALLFRAAGLLVLDQSPSLPSSVLSGWARISALAFAAMAAFTVVLSISGPVSRWFSLRWIGWTSWLRPSRAHSVALGLGPMAQELIQDIRQPTPSGTVAEGGPGGADAEGSTGSQGSTGDLPARRRVVAVGTGGEDGNSARRAQDLGALVLPGEAKSKEVLGKLRLDLAREVFVTAAEDARALDTAGALFRFAETLPQGDSRGRSRDRSHDGALQCYVHIGDPAYADLFREHPLFQAPGGQVEFHVFNDRELSALHLLLDGTQGLATAHAPEEEEVAHYVLVGFGANGQTIATQAARLAHFSGRSRLRMTVVDDFQGRDGQPDPAGPALRSFLARYPAFAPEDLNLLDHARLSDPGKDTWSYRGPKEDYRPACKSAQRERPAIEYVVNAEFLDLPAEDPDLADQLCARFAAEGDRPVRPVVVACFDEEGRSFRTALRLKELLAVQAQEATHSGTALPSIPIVAFLPQEEGLAELIANETSPREEPLPQEPLPEEPLDIRDGSPAESGSPVTLRAAGMHSRAVGYRQVVRPVLRDLARSIARHYEELYGPGEVAEDFWEKLSPAFKKSNEDAAAHAVVKLRTIGSVYPLFGKSVASGSEESPQTLPSSTRPDPVSPGLLGQMEHNRFVAERLLGEWRYEPYPEGYDDWSDERKSQLRKEMKDRKRRASLCPFENLPAEDVPKDDEQVIALRDALSRMGIEVPHLTEWIRSRPDIGADASGDSAPPSS